jgi:hypothetical protein
MIFNLQFEDATKRRGLLVGHLGGGFFMVQFSNEDGREIQRVVNGSDMGDWTFAVPSEQNLPPENTSTSSDKEIEIRRGLIGLEFMGETL